MANKTTEVSFAIRFKPSSLCDDDDEDDDDLDPLRCKAKKESVLFERHDITAAQGPGACETDVMQIVDMQSTQKHPDTLWNGQTDSSKLAHVSDTSSPQSPLEVSNANEKILPGKTATATVKDVSKDLTATPTVEKSLFSGLRERLDRFSAESKEIFDRKMRRSGSADAAKITALLNDSDLNKVSSGESAKSVESKHTRSPSDGSSVNSEQSTSCTTPVDQCDNGVMSSVTGVASLMHKSASVGAAHLTKNDDIAVLDSLSWNKRSSVATDHELLKFRSAEKVSMSDLLTSYSEFELHRSVTSETVDNSVDNADLETEPEHTDSNHHVAKPSSLKFLLHQKFSCFTAAFQKWKLWFSVIIVLIACILRLLPTYLSGFITGSLCTALVMVAHRHLTRLKKTSDVPAKPTLSSSPAKSFDTSEASKAEIKDMTKSKCVEEKFKGWMNELNQYDVEDYHITQTYSVLVTLEGTTLRLQTPKHGIAKRAIVDESIPPATFVRQRHFDLYGGRVYLLPSDLVSKRLWSKKYPICIEPIKSPKTRAFEFVAKDQDLYKQRSPEGANNVSDISGSLKRNADSDHDLERQRGQGQGGLYLFARTCREKEEWYRRFVAATRGTPWPLHMGDITGPWPLYVGDVVGGPKSIPWPSHIGDVTKTPRSTSPERQQITSLISSPKLKHRRSGSTDSTSSNLSVDLASTPVAEINYGLLSPDQNLAEYVKYMMTIMAAGNAPSPSDSDGGTSTQSFHAEQTLVWLNALIGRCFLDFLREKYWAEKMREKIQKKLCKMHVPHFIDKLSVTGIELGSSVPTVCRVHPPFLDDRGLWVDLDITYQGGFCISMATKCNLMKLKQSTTSTDDIQSVATKEKRSAVTHSDEEDSAESTTDEENVEDNSAFDPTDDKRPEPMGKKLLRFVDKISQSRYFQQATEYKYIKKAMEEVSNTLLVLNVEVCSINGTLSVNIPPPPSDRIWYGFRGNPDLVLSAKPYVGEREVSLSPVTDWIEKKLAVEFQRVFVMPNMDDIPIPLMCPHLA